MFPQVRIYLRDEGAYEVRSLPWEHAHPTLSGIDRERIAELAGQIMRIATDRVVWTKWSGGHETLAERAAEICVPVESLREVLNALLGPRVPRSMSNSVFASSAKTLERQLSPGGSWGRGACPLQRGRGQGHRVHRYPWLDGGVVLGCPRAPAPEGGEGASRADHCGQTAHRGPSAPRSDCPWTAAIGTPDLHCCKNDRLYRLHPLNTAGKYEPAFEVLRVDYLDAKRGRSVGRYRTRGQGQYRRGKGRPPGRRPVDCRSSPAVRTTAVTVVEYRRHPVR